MNNLARKNIATLTPYIAGKPIEETKRELGLSEVIKLASNENPLGASPKAVAAMRKALATVNRYPDSGGFYLKKKLGERLKVAPGAIVLGNGSDELIDTLIKTFVEDDENIVTGDVTFLEYAIIARTNCRTVRQVPLKEFRFDLEAMARTIDAKTKLVFIANPNNPTGTYVTKSELGKFLGMIPRTVLVVLDEAYDLFIDVDDYASGMQYLDRNVIVLKTFSKAYGLAGLRVGYAVGNPVLTAAMEKVRQPFNVNLLAQAAATAALDDERFLARTRKVVLEGKRSLAKALGAMGVRFVPSVANFILVDCGRDGVEVFKKMLKEGVIVRDMNQYGLKNFVRVTVGTPAENRRFVTAFKKVIL